MRANTYSVSHSSLRVIGLLIAVFTLGLLITSPAIRTTVNETLYPLGVRLGPPSQATSEQFAEIPLVSFEEAQQRIPFHIPVPTWLPEGMTLRGAHVQGDWINLSYAGSANRASSGMGIEISRGQVSGNYVVPDSAKQSVVANGRTATYVHGAWNQQMQWDGTVDAGSLTWEANGFTYRLGYSALALSREDIIRIAESLR